MLCRDYEKKEWCGLEWRAIHALIKERKSSDVMLCRFDQAKVNGLFSTAGLEIFTKLGSPSLATARSTLSDCRLAFALERLNHA